MTLPTKLTIGRLGLTVVFMFLLFLAASAEQGGSRRLMAVPPFVLRAGALVVFLAAVVTDALDGRLARRHGLETDLGRLLDPLADKILISAALISFVQLREIHVPAWMVVVIISREFAVTGLRGMAAAKGRVLPATPAGKLKTAWQMAAIVAVLVFLVVRDALFELARQDAWVAIDGWMRALVYCTMLVAVVLSAVSGCMYLYRNRDVYLGEG